MKTQIGILLFLLSFAVLAKQNQVERLRFWSDVDHTRLVIETQSAARYKLMRLSHPDRLVIDFTDTRLNVRLPKNKQAKSYVKKIRSGIQNGKNLRLVLDLSRPAKAKVFSIEKDAKNQHRLVVDLFGRSTRKASKPKKSVVALVQQKKVLRKKPSVRQVKKPTAIVASKPRIIKPKNNNLSHSIGRDLVVAIDAGHGGRDSGAVGKRGAKEKHVALAIAKKLAALVNKEKGMRAVLIRKGDYYVPLKKRVKIAHDHHADLFVSIHADSFATSEAKGASVYTLSNKGATSAAARLLARRENSSDLIGGVELKGQTSDLAKVLIDLAQTGSRDASYEVAGSVLSELKRVGRVHNRRVQKAGFAVLKSASIPSILIETAYISNPDEERKLKSGKHQRKLANSILKGVRRYFYSNPVPGTLMAESLNTNGAVTTNIKQGINLNATPFIHDSALAGNDL